MAIRVLRFRVTADHLKLLRRMYVGWQDCEYGAPEIDPKRPYGNSSVEQDIAEILGWIDRNGEVSDEMSERCAALHRGTQHALQIALCTGSFQEGEYVRDEYQWNWRPA